MSQRSLRRRRREAAARFKPDDIKLLLIAHAPPAADDRYFYFPNVAEHDSLFRFVARLVLGAEPTRTNKRALLTDLQRSGVFLIDLCLDPDPAEWELKGFVPDLVKRASRLEPEHIILIKASVYNHALGPLRTAGLPVVDVLVPFPGSGQQLRFESAMREALTSIGWTHGR